jgi:transcriptional regulator with XRE-family HTH domain
MPKRFNDWFKKVRTSRGLTMAKAAKELGISEPTVSRWEDGAAVPRVGYLLRLIKWGKISATSLLRMLAL